MIQQVFSKLPLYPLPRLLFLYPHNSVVRCGSAMIHGTNIKYQGGVSELSIISPPLNGNHSKKKHLFCNASLTLITLTWWSRAIYKLLSGVDQQFEPLEAQNLLLFSLPTFWGQKSQESGPAHSLVAFLARRRWKPMYYMYGCIIQGAGVQGCIIILKWLYAHNNLWEYSLGFLQLWMTISWFRSFAYQLKSRPTKEQKQFNFASLHQHQQWSCNVACKQ